MLKLTTNRKSHQTLAKVAMLQKVKAYHSEALSSLKDHFTPFELGEKILDYPTINLELCGRLRTCGGKALTDSRNNYALIKLNYRLFEGGTTTDDDLKNTYLHELAHVLVNRIHGKSQKHNSNWLEMAKLVGCTGEIQHEMDVSAFRSNQQKALCPDCEYPHRVSKRVHNKMKAAMPLFLYKCAKHELGMLPV